MKTTIKKLLFMAVLLGTLTSHASQVSTIPDSPNKEKIKASVVVKDDSGAVIYLSPIKQKGDLTMLFDYSLLEDGHYSIEIENEYLVEIHAFKVFENKVEFIDISTKTIYKPVFQKENSKISISKVAFDSNQMKVDLFYENELIHSETISTNSPILKRAYQLDSREKGNYYAVMTSNGRVYTEKFKL
jgi:uncharacterized pyridoxamine 5'-phosphate oxidase family protein